MGELTLTECVQRRGGRGVGGCAAIRRPAEGRGLRTVDSHPGQEAPAPAPFRAAWGGYSLIFGEERLWDRCVEGKTCCSSSREGWLPGERASRLRTARVKWVVENADISRAARGAADGVVYSRGYGVVGLKFVAKVCSFEGAVERNVCCSGRSQGCLSRVRIGDG